MATCQCGSKSWFIWEGQVTSYQSNQFSLFQSLNEQSIDSGNAHVFRPQPQFGIAYKDDGFISFQAQVMDLQSVVSLENRSQ